MRVSLFSEFTCLSGRWLVIASLCAMVVAWSPVLSAAPCDHVEAVEDTLYQNTHQHHPAKTMNASDHKGSDCCDPDDPTVSCQDNHCHAQPSSIAGVNSASMPSDAQSAFDDLVMTYRSLHSPPSIRPPIG